MESDAPVAAMVEMRIVEKAWPLVQLNDTADVVIEWAGTAPDLVPALAAAAKVD